MTAQANPPTAPPPSRDADAAANTLPTREEKARGLVRRNAYWALGSGMIPFPLIDFLAITTVQVKLLKELSELYGVEFFDDKAKKIIGSLITGLGSVSLVWTLAGSFAKALPVLGQLIGVVGMPIVSGALTLAVGNLFVMHYESGGTLLDFDASKLRAHFRDEFEKSQATARRLKEDPGQADEPLAP